jgi:hypothetical protein
MKIDEYVSDDDANQNRECKIVQHGWPAPSATQRREMVREGGSNL